MTTNKQSHNTARFSNTDSSQINVPFATLLRHLWQARGLPKPPSRFIDGYNFPLIKPAPEFLSSNKYRATFTWLGHASALLQLRGRNILVDPVFSKYLTIPILGPRRKVAMPIDPELLPPIDAVVISHNHYDHLDMPTLRALVERAGTDLPIFVPLGLVPLIKNTGARCVYELNWWQSEVLGDLKFTLVPAQHWSARSLFDRNKTLWGGWVVESDDFRFYFTGDTGYSVDFVEIGNRFDGFDLAAIAVGAYEPRWFMSRQHINPAEAVQIHQDIRSRQSIGVHWGTFELTNEPLDQPIGDLAEALANQNVSPEAFILLKHGETKNFD